MGTIHQPSTALFMSFTDILFLANGRVAYHGPPSNVKPHCESIGKPVPEDTNPADHFMQLINSEFVSRAEVDEVVGRWMLAPERKGGELPALADCKRPSILSATCTLLHRHFKLSIRDPTLYIGRMGMFIISNSFFSLVYWNAREWTQETVIPKYFHGGWMVAVPTLFSMIAVYNANEDFRIIRKEYKNGMTPVGSYLLAVFLLQLPYMAMLSIAALIIPDYGLANANTLQMIPTIFVVAVTLWSFEQSAVCFGVCFNNSLVGMLAAIGLWFASFLFSGAFLKPSFVIWPLKLCTYIFPLRWAFLRMSYLGIHGAVYEGAVSLPDGKFSCGAGFGPCYGHTGDQVLASLGTTFPVGSSGTLAEQTGYILAYGVVFKVLHIALMLGKTRFGRPAKTAIGKKLKDEPSSDEPSAEEFGP